MSDFTTELRYLVEANKVHVNPDFPIGLDQYPIFDETYRPILNQLIINHFYFHEIGFESSQRFIFEINNVMREIMPYYNQLYKAELLTYDPFVEYSKEIAQVMNQSENTVDSQNESIIDKIIEVIDGLTQQDSTSDTEGNSTQTDNSNQLSKVGQDENVVSATVDKNKQTESSDSRNVGSNTPKDLLAIGTIENNVYASEATISDGSKVVDTDNDSNANSSRRSDTDSSSETTSNTTTTDGSKVVVDSDTKEDKTVNKDSETTKEVSGETSKDTSGNTSTVDSGHNKSKTQLIVELRESFINVDQMILNDLNLNECFMMVYGNC